VGEWAEKASLALEAGYAPEDVAAAAFGAGRAFATVEWIDSEAGMWDEWIQQFRPLARHKSEDIRRVAEAGIAIAQRRRDRSRMEERREAVYGES
jgi:hypothetical protein